MQFVESKYEGTMKVRACARVKILSFCVRCANMLIRSVLVYVENIARAPQLKRSFSERENMSSGTLI